MPPAYNFLLFFSSSSIISIALILGAPLTVPAGKPDKRVSNIEKLLLNFKVDEKIIGGLIIKVGSKMIDASILSKINKLNIAMKEA